MEYISSDTNVWIDFMAIDKVELPFLLPCTYIMSDDAVNDELLSPEGFKDALLQNGLKPVEYTEEEFTLADSYGSRYPKLSIYDRLALSIAKVRGIILLTGDRPLRRAAATEGVLCVVQAVILPAAGVHPPAADGRDLGTGCQERRAHRRRAHQAPAREAGRYPRVHDRDDPGAGI